MSALAEHIREGLKNAGHGRVPVEGLAVGDWVLIDAGDVIVHHLGTLHGAGGNASPTATRRAITIRYGGDDSTYKFRRFAPKFLNTPTVSLEDRSDPYHPYGAYLWMLYATKLVSGSCAPGGRTASTEGFSGAVKFPVPVRRASSKSSEAQRKARCRASARSASAARQVASYARKAVSFNRAGCEPKWSRVSGRSLFRQRPPPRG